MICPNHQHNLIIMADQCQKKAPGVAALQRPLWLPCEEDGPRVASLEVSSDNQGTSLSFFAAFYGWYHHPESHQTCKKEGGAAE